MAKKFTNIESPSFNLLHDPYYSTSEDNKYFHGSDLSGFKNYKEINSTKLPILSLEEFKEQAPLQLIKSACGTGKNYRLKSLVKELVARDERVIVVNPRRALCKSSATELGLDCYLDLAKGDIHGSAVVCLDSIPRIRLQDRPALLLVDEVAQVAQHSFGGTIRGQNNVDKIHKHMQSLFSCAEKIITQDADLDAETARHVLSWAKNRRIEDSDFFYETICNKAKPFDPITRKYPTEDQYWTRLLVAGFRGKIWEFCTSAKKARTHYEAYKEAYPDKKAICIHQGVMGEPHVMDCIENPRNFDKYDAVFTSPSVQTGISIEHENTWHVFGYIYGIGSNGPTINDAHQGINRVRHPIDNTWNIFVKGKTNTTDQSIQEIINDHKYVNKKTEEFLKGIQTYPLLNQNEEEVIKLMNEELFFRAADLKVREHRYGGKFDDSFDDFKNLVPGAFRRLWNEKGFQIINEEYLSTPEYNFKEISEKITEEDINKIIEADIITKEEAEEESKKNLTEESQAEIESSRIREFYSLGEEKPSEEQVKEYIYQGRTKLMQFAETNAFIQGYEKELSLLDSKKVNCDIHSRHVCLKSKIMKNFFEKVGIDIKTLTKRIKDEEDINTIQKEFEENPIKKIEYDDEFKEDLKKVFGMRITGGKSMNISRSLLGKLGLTIKRSSQQINRQYQYYLDIHRFKKCIDLSNAYYNRLTTHQDQSGQLNISTVVEIKTKRKSRKDRSRERFIKNKVMDHELDELVRNNEPNDKIEQNNTNVFSLNFDNEDVEDTLFDTSVLPDEYPYEDNNECPENIWFEE